MYNCHLRNIARERAPIQWPHIGFKYLSPFPPCWQSVWCMKATPMRISFKVHLDMCTAVKMQQIKQTNEKTININFQLVAIQSNAREKHFVFGNPARLFRLNGRCNWDCNLGPSNKIWLNDTKWSIRGSVLCFNGNRKWNVIAHKKRQSNAFNPT